jgi:hypothetical protein
VVTCAGVLVDPEAFASLDEFVAHVRAAYVDTWVKAHTDEDDAVPFEPPMGTSHPIYKAPSEAYKTQILRFAFFLACVLLFSRARKALEAV